jgi:ribosomal protein L11 methyltransferase
LNWLEVSLTVNGELAEAVADVLARFAPNGVMTEQTVKFKSAEDEGTPVEPIVVRAYLPADERLEETRHNLEEALFYLGMIQPIPKPEYTPIADQNWMDAWKEHYHPIPIGKRLIIVPVWLESPDSRRISIKIDPGMAFGTGTHPTTQLCLDLLEEYLSPQCNVIDVGCGSGILSIGALKLGARFALAVDIDEASVKGSRENSRVNDIRDDQIAIGLGSVKNILAGNLQFTTQEVDYPRQAELVLVNILAPIIASLFNQDGLADLVTPGGSIILSGILDGQQSDLVELAVHHHGLTLIEERLMGDWVALAFKRPII